jgi:hypothetical protein
MDRAGERFDEDRLVGWQPIGNRMQLIGVGHEFPAPATAGVSAEAGLQPGRNRT